MIITCALIQMGKRIHVRSEKAKDIMFVPKETMLKTLESVLLLMSGSFQARSAFSPRLLKFFVGPRVTGQRPRMTPTSSVMGIHIGIRTTYHEGGSMHTHYVSGIGQHTLGTGHQALGSGH